MMSDLRYAQLKKNHFKKVIVFQETSPHSFHIVGIRSSKEDHEDLNSQGTEKTVHVDM